MQHDRGRPIFRIVQWFLMRLSYTDIRMSLELQKHFVALYIIV